MTDKEKRAHDIAVSLLPRAIKDRNFNLYNCQDGGMTVFNDSQIVEEYERLYLAIFVSLNDLDQES